MFSSSRQTHIFGPTMFPAAVVVVVEVVEVEVVEVVDVDVEVVEVVVVDVDVEVAAVVEDCAAFPLAVTGLGVSEVESSSIVAAGCGACGTARPSGTPLP